MCSVSRPKKSSNPRYTHSALGIPVLIGPNPGMCSYGVVAVLDERYGISNHPVTNVPPWKSYVGVLGTKTVVSVIYTLRCPINRPISGDYANRLRSGAYDVGGNIAR